MIKDLTGQRFGRYTVIGFAGVKNKTAYWKCRCDCGNERVVSGAELRRGKSKSCGCLHRDMMIRDLTGQQFGRLKVIEYVGTKNNHAAWKCECECGNECIKSSKQLLTNGVKSCGCLLTEVTIARSTIHEMSNTKIYQTWVRIKQRCFDLNFIGYDYYGGRGITVCDEWQNDFVAFYNHVSKLEHFGEDGYSLDRINNDGNYEPGNVRWATPKEQARNKRTTVFVEYGGEKISLQEAAERSGIDYTVLKKRWAVGKRGDELFKTKQKPLPTIEYNGEKMTLKLAAKTLGISYSTLYSRYQAGKCGDDLLKK